MGPFPALVIGQTGERVLGDDVLEVWHAHHAGHGLGGVVENVGDNGSSWQAQALHLDPVVHTARTAGASITDPGDENVHLVQHVLDHIGLGGQGRGMLVEEDDVFQIVLLFHHLAQFV